MFRRDLLKAASLPAVVSLAGPARAAEPGGTAFDANAVRTLAHDLAQKPFQAPDAKLPDALAHLTYDQYRMIRFNPQRALWHGQNLPFELQFFHRGFLYANRVDLFEVADGRAQPILYSPDLFDFGSAPRPTGNDLGFAGFRVHAPLNRPDYFDEVCVFLGASYFRAVAKGQGYGLSARGLAIKTADRGGEEFPLFKTFWIERPHQGTNALVIHALLDSASGAAAYRFTVRPGEDTVFDTEMTLYPRVEIDQAGIAPMTSMFMFDANDRMGIDDYRPGVHDSDGLLMLTGKGEQLWRPLANPVDLQVSVFTDVGTRGFGLMQRKRQFAAYDDLEAHYENRPSLWAEPIGGAWEGAVQLVEIPDKQEIHDNMVMFWRPTDPLHAKGEYRFTYRLHWCDAPNWNPDLARFTDTRIGAAGDGKGRLFVLDSAGDKLKAMGADAKLRLEVSADHGKIANPVALPNPQTGGWRMSFEMTPDGKTVEMRARLMSDAGPVSETWVYRWTA